MDPLTLVCRWIRTPLLRHVPLRARYPYFYPLGFLATGTEAWHNAEIAVMDGLYLLCMQLCVLTFISYGERMAFFRTSAGPIEPNWYKIPLVDTFIRMRMSKVLTDVLEQPEQGVLIQTPGPAPPLALHTPDAKYPWRFHRLAQPRCIDDSLNFKRHWDAAAPRVFGPDGKYTLVRLIGERLPFILGNAGNMINLDDLNSVATHAVLILYHTTVHLTLASAWLSGRVRDRDLEYLVRGYGEEPDLSYLIEWESADVGKSYLHALVQAVLSKGPYEPYSRIVATSRMGHVSARRVISPSISFYVLHVNMAPKVSIRNPHVYAFLTHGAGCLRTYPSSGGTRLEKMYTYGGGQMVRMTVGESERYDLESRYSREELVRRGARVYFVVFYEKIGGAGGNADTVVPQYEVAAHCHMLVKDVLALERDPHALPALTGPTTSVIEFDDDYITTTPFGAAWDSTLHVNRDEFKMDNATDASREGVHSASSFRLKMQLDSKDEPVRNRFFRQTVDFFHTQRTPGTSAGSEGRRRRHRISPRVLEEEEGGGVAHTLAYTAYPTETLDLPAVLHLAPQCVPSWKIYELIDRALTSHVFSHTTFAALCARLESEIDAGRGAAPETEWGLCLFRSVVAVAFNLFGVLAYCADSVNGTPMDQMQDARLLGQGDCEDSAQANRDFVVWFTEHTHPKDPAYHESPAVAAIHHILKDRYVPCYTVMWVRYDGSPMHSVMTLVPRSKFDQLESPASYNANHDRWLAILVEGTCPTSPNTHRCAVSGAAAESVQRALAVWKHVHEENPSDAWDRWMAPRPPADDYRGGFYEGFVSVCAAYDGKKRYYAFSGPTERGASLPAVTGGVGEYTLQRAGRTNAQEEEVTRANAYIGDYTIPVPCFASEREELKPLDFALYADVQAQCAAFNTTRDKAAPAAAPDDLRVRALTLSYNPAAASKGGSEQARKSLATILSKCGDTVRFCEARQYEPLPLFPVIEVVAYF
jgi:hypothetical protein